MLQIILWHNITYLRREKRELKVLWDVVFLKLSKDLNKQKVMVPQCPEFQFRIEAYYGFWWKKYKITSDNLSFFESKIRLGNFILTFNKGIF